MTWKWKKRVSSVVIGAVLLSLIPFGGATASTSPKLLDSPMYTSLAPEISEKHAYPMNQSKFLIPSTFSKSEGKLVYVSAIPSFDPPEVNTVSGATYTDMRSKVPRTEHVIKELTEKRSRNSKTYLNSDGTTTVQTSVYSLNYFDGQSWKNIDTRIRPDGTDPNYTHSMSANNFKVKLNNKGINQSVTFSVYDQSVTYRAIGMNNVTGDVYENTTIYRNAWQSTDLLYQVQNDQMKMELHLADNKAPKKFEFEMKTKDVTSRVNADGSIDFINDNGDVSFQIPRLWVKDASSDEERYDKLKIDLKQKGNKTVLEFTLDDRGLQYPVIIDPTTSLPVIAGGNSHMLELRNNGTVWAYGDNSYGQLGDGTKNRNNNMSPILVSGLSNVVAVATGAYHSLALKQDGTVWAWGRNTTGQLGNGTNNDSLLPIQVSDLSNVVSIAAGIDYSVAITNNGTVFSWGSNSYGQLGNGTFNSSNTPVYTFSPPAVTIAAGSDHTHTLALDERGTVWAWGSNSYGQLGNGGRNANTMPVSVINNVVAIAAGHDFSIAVKQDGTVWTWGKNDYGQSGNGMTSTSPTLKPVQVSGLYNVIGVSAGENHSLILKKDGTVWAWGQNNMGQLGNDSTQKSTIPKQVLLPVESGLTNVVAVVAGAYHSIAVNLDGSNWVWGDSPFGVRGGFPIYTAVRPETPTSLTVTGKSSNSVTLSWLPSSGNIGTISYDISNYLQQWVGYVEGNTTTYTVTGLNPNTRYSFTVTARSSQGLPSAPSNAVNVLTDNKAPTAPMNLKMSSNTNSTLSLTWKASIDDVGVTGYDIYKGATLVGSVDGNTTSYTVSGLTANVVYSFTVKAKNAAGGISAASNVAYFYTGNYQYVYNSSGRVDYILLSSGQKLKYIFDLNGNLLSIQLK